MTEKIRAKISGIGAYVPDYVLTNDELSRMVDTNDERITTRVGIKERHILKIEGEGSSYMGERAVRQLFEKTGTNPDEIDLVLCATVTPDMPFPATASIIADKVGIKNAMHFDINAGCSGFIYTLITAKMYVESGQFKADKHIHHTHEGSIGNLCNEQIVELMNKVVAGFHFDRVQQAEQALLHSAE